MPSLTIRGKEKKQDLFTWKLSPLSVEVLGREETQSAPSGRILLCCCFADHSCRRLQWQKTWYNSTVGLRQEFCKGCNVCWVGNYTAGTGDKGKITAQSSLYRKLFRDRWLQRTVILRDETLPFACVCRHTSCTHR